MTDLINGNTYIIKFYISGHDTPNQECGVYDEDCDCFFVDGDESVGIHRECVVEWINKAP